MSSTKLKTFIPGQRTPTESPVEWQPAADSPVPEVLPDISTAKKVRQVLSWGAGGFAIATAGLLTAEIMMGSGAQAAADQTEKIEGPVSRSAFPVRVAPETMERCAAAILASDTAFPIQPALWRMTLLGADNSSLVELTVAAGNTASDGSVRAADVDELDIQLFPDASIIQTAAVGVDFVARDGVWGAMVTEAPSVQEYENPAAVVGAMRSLLSQTCGVTLALNGGHIDITAGAQNAAGN